MLGSSISLIPSRISTQPTMMSLKSRINFIAARRSKQWLSIDNSPLKPLPDRVSLETSPSLLKNYPTKQQETTEVSKTLSYSKAKSIQLQDLKSRRYLQCKEDSAKLLKELEARRAAELQGKQLKRLRVIREQQQGRQALRMQEETRIRENRQSKHSSEAAMLEETRELQRQEEKQLRRYQSELSYRSVVMRRIQQMLHQDQLLQHKAQSALKLFPTQ